MNRMLRGRKARRGFTLIELLVVVLILGVLLAVAIPLYLNSVKNSSIVTTKANLKTVAVAAQAYFVKNGTYPTNMTTLTGAGDLSQTPTGPRGVTYTLSGSATDCTVTATEDGTQDAFGTTAVNNTGTYINSTGAYSGL